jgi:hypothetical protein
MIKKVIVLIFIILLCTVAGAVSPDIVQNQYAFTGENDSWNAVYTERLTAWFTQGPAGLHYSINAADKLTISYKKDISALASVKHFKVAFQIGSGGGSIEGDGPVLSTTYTFRNINYLPMQKDTAATVTIELDGAAQTIELKNNQLVQIAAVMGPAEPVFQIRPPTN